MQPNVPLETSFYCGVLKLLLAGSFFYFYVVPLFAQSWIMIVTSEDE